MPRYIQNFKKTVWGYAYVNAPNKKKAQQLFDEGEYDEFDNKSDYDFEGEVIRG